MKSESCFSLAMQWLASPFSMKRLFCPEENAVFMKLFLAVAVLFNISLSENYSFFQKYFRSFDKMHSEVILQQKNIELER